MMHRFALGYFSCLLLSAACSSGATSPTENDGAVAEDGAGLVDAGVGDSGPPDVGSPASCSLSPVVTRLAEGFSGELNEDPLDFVSLADEGPWMFAYRREEGTEESVVGELEARAVDEQGVFGEPIAIDSVSGSAERLSRARLASIAEGAFVVWEHTESDGDGALVSSEVRHAAISNEGSIIRPPSVLRADASSPFIASRPDDDDVWVMRSDLVTAGEITVVQPRVDRLTAAGDSKNCDGVDAGSDCAGTIASEFVPPEGQEYTLAAGDNDWLGILYRVPPSTLATVPLFESGVPHGTTTSVVGIPFIDSVHATDDFIAVGWTETVGGTARVGVVLLEPSGAERARRTLAEFEASYLSRIAVVGVWPGVVAVWREGTGEEAIVRAAGLASTGHIIVEPVDLVSTPYAGGDLLAISDGVAIALGYRVREDGNASELGFARVCGPR